MAYAANVYREGMSWKTQLRISLFTWLIVGFLFLTYITIEYPSNPTANFPQTSTNNKFSEIRPIYKKLDVGPSMYTTTSDEIAKKNINCLAKNIYHEARGESYLGQVAVAFVTMNRAQEKFYNDTCKTVYERKAFSWTFQKIDPIIRDQKSWAIAEEVATKVYRLELKDPTSGMTSYYNPKKVAKIYKAHKPSWALNVKKAINIGNHRFMKVAWK